MSRTNYDDAFDCKVKIQHVENKTVLKSFLTRQFTAVFKFSNFFLRYGSEYNELIRLINDNIIDLNMLRYFNYKNFCNIHNENNSLFRLFCLQNNFINLDKFHHDIYEFNNLKKLIKNCSLRITNDDFENCYQSELKMMMTLDTSSCDENKKTNKLIQSFASFKSYNNVNIFYNRPTHKLYKYHLNWLRKDENFSKLKSDFIDYRNYYKVIPNNQLKENNVKNIIYSAISNYDYKTLDRISKIKCNIIFLKNNNSNNMFNPLKTFFDSIHRINIDRFDRISSTAGKSFETMKRRIDGYGICSYQSRNYLNQNFLTDFIIFNNSIKEILDNTFLVLDNIFKLCDYISFDMKSDWAPVILDSVSYYSEYNMKIKLLRLLITLSIIDKYKETEKLECLFKHNLIFNEDSFYRMSRTFDEQNRRCCKYLCVGEILLCSICYEFINIINLRNERNIYSCLCDKYKKLIINTLNYLKNKVNEFYRESIENPEEVLHIDKFTSLYDNGFQTRFDFDKRISNIKIFLNYDFYEKNIEPMLSNQ